MGIRFNCPNGHKLNVKKFLAGKRGICPQCDARFLVPFESGGQVETLIESGIDSREAVMPDPPAPGAETQLAVHGWHVRSASGDEQGPLPLEQVNTMIQAGQLNKDSWVWRAGWLDWQRASEAFPGIVPPPPAGTSIDSPPIRPPGIEVQEFVPQESEVVAAHRRLQRERRQRARTLTLALGGLICLLAVVLVVVLLK